MKPPPFEYYAPDTLQDAVTLLDRYDTEGEDVMIIAGGQNTVPMLAMRVARPKALIDLRRIAGLNQIREENGVIAIGAMATKNAAERSELIRSKQPLFHTATKLIGHLHIRNRGTVGGSFAHADPAAEYPAVALVTDTQMKIAGPEGERVVTAEEFFVTYMTTCMEENEILTEIRVPVLPAGSGWAIQEVARRHGDLALAGVALTLRLENGLCRDARMAAFGVNATAVRMPAGEAELDGQPPTVEVFNRASVAAAAALEEPMSCIHASSEQRRQTVRTLTERCLSQAAGRAS